MSVWRMRRWTGSRASHDAREAADDKHGLTQSAGRLGRKEGVSTWLDAAVERHQLRMPGNAYPAGFFRFIRVSSPTAQAELGPRHPDESVRRN
jgi:hypothetical protein